MTQGWGSLRRWARSQVVIALAGIFFATLSAHSQSDPAALMPDCAPMDQQAPLAGHPSTSALGSARGSKAGISATGTVIQEIRGTSFPELVHVDLRVRTFQSQSDYFRTRFSSSRFLFLMRMRYYVEVNPALFQGHVPAAGVCAVLAHELAHVVSLSQGNRFRRFGLVRLLSKGYTAKFERRTDLEAIHRGYGDGLKSYRAWVYTHIPPAKLPEKLRNYFSPEEIAAIQIRLQAQPELFAYWSKHVPANLGEIQRARK